MNQTIPVYMYMNEILGCICIAIVYFVLHKGGRQSHTPEAPTCCKISNVFDLKT